jgi:arylsulfatase A-like enzyme
MNRKAKAVIGAVLLAGAATAWFMLRPARGANGRIVRIAEEALPVDRERFVMDGERQRLLFVDDGRREPLDDAPDVHGGRFFLRGGKRVALGAPLTGRVGLHSTLYLEGRPASQSIEFALEIEGRGGSRVVRRIRAPRTSYALFQEFDLRRGERIVLRFSGRGIVCFSRPLLYEATADPRRRANVILVAVDTFRADMLGARPGGLPSLTPALDRFAGDAVRLDNAVAPTSWTLPSFMSLLTGRNEYRHGAGIQAPLRPDVPSLVESLAPRFAAIGFHGGMVMKGRWGFARGFDLYREFAQASTLYPQGGRSLFEKAMEVLKAGRLPRLFLFLHTYQLHSPYTPPEEFLLRLNPRPAQRRLDAVNYAEPAKTYLPVAPAMRGSLLELYQAEVAAFDAYFGDFVAALKREGLYDNSLIVLTSDHGEEFFEHGGWSHAHSLYDELLRVPLLIKFPGGRFGGRRLRQPVGLVDVLPTILGYHRLPFPAADLDGMDLMPLIRGRDVNRERAIVSTMSTGRYYEHFPLRIALVQGRYKLVYNEPFTAQGMAAFSAFAPPPVPGPYELFDLDADPGETRNLVAALPRQKAKMLPLLMNVRRQIAAAAAGGRKTGLDDESRRQLEALGYL